MEIQFNPMMAGGIAGAVVADGTPRGSCYFITRGLALTASFVVEDLATREPEPKLAVRPLGGNHYAEASVIWTSDRYKASLLRLKGAPREVVADCCRMGRLVDAGTHDIDVIGFQRDPDRQRDESLAVRITGTIDVRSWRESLFFRFDASAPLTDDVLGSGGSGACAGEHLIGIVEAVHREANWFRIIPISEIMKDPAFRESLKGELGGVPDIDALQSASLGVADAIKEVSKADPANIQEVAAAQFGLSNLYYENVLSQARRSFNAAVVAAIAGFAFFIAAVGFALQTRQLSASIVSLVGGGVVEVVAGLNFWLYGRASIQLNAFHLRLERMQRFLLANSVSASLAPDARDAALAQLVQAISQSQEDEKTSDAGV